MSETKKSNKGCLIALAIVGAFLVIVMIGGIFLFYKAKDLVEDVAAGAGVSEEMRDQARSLDRRYAFTPPADNLIREDQIQTFIKVKQTFAHKIKSREEEFKQFAEKAEAEKGEFSFKRYAEFWKILAEIRSDFLKALDENRMSTREYGFLSRQIYQTYLTDMATGFAELATNMGASAAEVGELEDQMAEIPEANRALFEKYSMELQEVNTLGIELWGLPLAEEY